MCLGQRVGARLNHSAPTAGRCFAQHTPSAANCVARAFANRASAFIRGSIQSQHMESNERRRKERWHRSRLQHGLRSGPRFAGLLLAVMCQGSFFPNTRVIESFPHPLRFCPYAFRFSVENLAQLSSVTQPG
jgi:hypothetical protein